MVTVLVIYWFIVQCLSAGVVFRPEFSIGKSNSAYRHIVGYIIRRPVLLQLLAGHIDHGSVSRSVGRPVVIVAPFWKVLKDECQRSEIN